jgi:hypothetical protein
MNAPRGDVVLSGRSSDIADNLLGHSSKIKRLPRYNNEKVHSPTAFEGRLSQNSIAALIFGVASLSLYASWGVRQAPDLTFT